MLINLISFKPFNYNLNLLNTTIEPILSPMKVESDFQINKEARQLMMMQNI